MTWYFDKFLKKEKSSLVLILQRNQPIFPKDNGERNLSGATSWQLCQSTSGLTVPFKDSSVRSSELRTAVPLPEEICCRNVSV